MRTISYDSKAIKGVAWSQLNGNYLRAKYDFQQLPAILRGSIIHAAEKPRSEHSDKEFVRLTKFFQTWLLALIYVYRSGTGESAFGPGTDSKANSPKQTLSTDTADLTQ